MTFRVSEVSFLSRPFEEKQVPQFTNDGPSVLHDSYKKTKMYVTLTRLALKTRG